MELGDPFEGRCMWEVEVSESHFEEFDVGFEVGERERREETRCSLLVEFPEELRVMVF